MRKQFLKTALMAVAGVGLLAGSAFALPSITGGMGITGSWKPILSNGTPTTIPLATGIDFGGYLQEGVEDNTFQVTSADGSFTGMVGDIGKIYNFQFDSFTPNNPLWTIGDFSFAMTSLSFAKSGQNTSNQLLIYGEGIISAGGFDPTPGYWNYSGQGGGGANFSWSASTGSPVPEPTTMLLFGTGLMGLAFVGRKIQK